MGIDLGGTLNPLVSNRAGARDAICDMNGNCLGGSCRAPRSVVNPKTALQWGMGNCDSHHDKVRSLFRKPRASSE
eukprot:3257172-Pyramimonas_sp.AAC.1